MERVVVRAEKKFWEEIHRMRCCLNQTILRKRQELSPEAFRSWKAGAIEAHFEWERLRFQKHTAVWAWVGL
jgi:hypothetical protein